MEFEEEFHLSDYLLVIRKRRWVILTVLFVVVVGVTRHRLVPPYTLTSIQVDRHYGASIQSWTWSVTDVGVWSLVTCLHVHHTCVLIDRR